MELANCSVIIGRFGSTVPRESVTPAEVQYLIHEHQESAGKTPILDLRIVGSIERNAVDEKLRLKEYYDAEPEPSRNKVEKMYPGFTPSLPIEFSQVVDKEGNRPFGAQGQPTAAYKDNSVRVGGRLLSPTELEQLVAAGEAALKLKPTLVAAGSVSSKDQDEENDGDND